MNWHQRPPPIQCQLTPRGLVAKTGETVGFDLLAGCLVALSEDTSLLSRLASTPPDVARCQSVLFASKVIVQSIANIASGMKVVTVVFSGLPSEDKVERDMEGYQNELNVDMRLNLLDVCCLNNHDLCSLIVLQKQIVKAGGKLTIFNVRPSLYKTFETMDLVSILHVLRA